MVNEEKKGSTSILRLIVRIVLVAIILGIVSFLTPGFSIRGMWSYIFAAVIISLLDYFIEKLMGFDAKPFGKGLKGFLISAVIIYAAQFFVSGMNVFIIGALLGALAIGILDAIFPVNVM